MSTTINDSTLTSARFSDELAWCQPDPTAESGRFRVRIDTVEDPDPYVEELGLADLHGWQFVQASMLQVGTWIEYNDGHSGSIRIERIA